MTSLLPSARPPATRRVPRRDLAVAGLVAALALSLIVAPAGRAQDADPVVAKVNGAEIRASDLAIAEEDIGGSMAQQPMTPEARREYVTTYIVDMMLVAKAAEDRKLGDGQDFKQRLAYHRNKILMEMLLQSEAKAAVTDAAMHKLYDEATKQMTGEKEVRARHILVETEDEAKAILAELAKGGDFAALAKQKSKDPGAAEGGDLGYFSREQMVPEFAEVAFKLEKGQLSEPVKSQFGWHIIKVEDKRAKPAPDFAQVKDQVETYVMRKTQADFITKLREGAKVERLDKK